MKVFHHVARATDIFQGEGAGLGNQVIDKVRKESWSAWTRKQMEGRKKKAVEKCRHPNLGAGYIQPVVGSLLHGLKQLAKQEAGLVLCRPLAVFVYLGVHKRFVLLCLTICRAVQ
jgi:hypothetical protein